ncbi:LamG domain-containing protein [Candidatus Poribacteria bacterium]|nr:LamG domain-containing protein [Candidatus Poribacteria bacterium]MYA99294.1 LamG domain-containing protein [Candidatus Poribacteria bacterium]
MDGEDDYAILPFAEHGHIFPEGTHAFTVEIWFYPKTEPKEKDRDLILNQQVSIGLLAREKCILGQNQLCSYRHAYLAGDTAHGLAGTDSPIQKDQWNYIAIIFKNGTLCHATNNRISQGWRLARVDRVSLNIRRPERVQDFVVGGYGEDKFVAPNGGLLYQVSSFQGEIDAIRFSNIARYDCAAQGHNPFDPSPRFLNDEHTLALWDFNDKEGADRFEDTSGNGKTLIGMNGATVIDGDGIGNLEIRPDTSLTTTWGQVKSESF